MAKETAAVPMVITVDRVLARKAKSGKTYSSVQFGEDYFNVWDTMVVDRLEVGQTYTVMVESTVSQGTTFNNIVGIAPDEMAKSANLANLMPGAKPSPAPAARPTTPAPALTSPPQAAPQPVVEPTIDPMIDVRKTALLCANALLAAEVITQKAMNEVLRKYESYILNGLKTEQIFDTVITPDPSIKDFVANE